MNNNIGYYSSRTLTSQGIRFDWDEEEIDQWLSEAYVESLKFTDFIESIQMERFLDNALRTVF